MIIKTVEFEMQMSSEEKSRKNILRNWKVHDSRRGHIEQLTRNNRLLKTDLS